MTILSAKPAYRFLPIALLALLGCALQPSLSAASGATEARFRTADGWTIVGDLYRAPNARRAVILLHQRGGTAADWQPLATALAKAGVTALAIDQRGAGRSTAGPGPTGESAPWSTSGDIAAAIRYLKPKGPVGLAGASYGANNALIYAAAHPKEVAGVALFSPGANYNGLDALAAARAYTGPAVIYHDCDDNIAGSGPQQIDRLLRGRQHLLRLYNGSGHGTALLNGQTISDAVQFFTRALKVAM